jgi:anti-sigma B factor antagonist
MDTICEGGLMTIQTEKVSQSVVELSLSGRLDTATAPQLERKLKQFGNEIIEVILDFLELNYISSMGLRVLLQAQKAMKAQGRKLVIRHMNASIREVFEMTGFINLMVQEEKFVVIKKEEDGAVVFSLIGEMDSNNISTLAEGLEALKSANEEIVGAVSIILDLNKLSLITSPGGKVLRETIVRTGWPQRQLVIRHAADKIRESLAADGLGNWFDPPAEIKAGEAAEKDEKAEKSEKDEKANQPES